MSNRPLVPDCRYQKQSAALGQLQQLATLRRNIAFLLVLGTVAALPEKSRCNFDRREPP